jgi:hypothetical protein
MTDLATAAVSVTAVTAALLGGSMSPASSTAGSHAGSHAVRATATAAAPPVTVNLRTSSPPLSRCFPNARSQVTVSLTTDTLGKDTFTIRAWGLRPGTDFTVFLIEKATPTFGAVEYIGDFTTNKQGRAVNTFTLIVEEAFAFNNTKGSRTDLNSIGFWFADPKDDNGCLGGKSPVTGFDGDASAGVQMMNSANRKLP